MGLIVADGTGLNKEDRPEGLYCGTRRGRLFSVSLLSADSGREE
jgi:hypothetical protein